MALTLSSADVAHLEDALQALLSPMDHGDTTAWRRQVTEKVRTLMGTNSVISIMRAPGTPLLVADGEYEQRALSEYAEYYYRQVVGEDVRIARGLTVWTREEIWPWESISRSEYYHDFCVPNAHKDSAGTAVSLPDNGEALLYINSDIPRRFAHDSRELVMLRLLRPALAAGARAAVSLGAMRTDWLMLDSTPTAIGIFDRSGKLAHANPPYAAILRDAVVGSTIERVADRMVRQGVAGGMTRPVEAGFGPTVTIRSPRGAYQLHLTRVEQAILGQAEFYMVIVTPPPEPVDATALVRRFRLTAREAEVALLVARGERNRAIATLLGTSVHTVRRQVEQVLAKLGVATRAAVAAKVHGR
jgi:DNA-binding CsgD family transcriptional regulator